MQFFLFDWLCISLIFQYAAAQDFTLHLQKAQLFSQSHAWVEQASSQFSLFVTNEEMHLSANWIGVQKQKQNKTKLN